MEIRFQTPYQYLFIHQNVKHLLLLWKKERKKEIYVVHEENNTLYLRYPGETYTEIVLDQISPIFFQQLETEEGAFQAVLGATFEYRGKLIGMYYPQENPTEQLYFFEIREDKILEIPDEEYESVVQTFIREFPEYIANPN
ncbi:hypothetical protein [Thermoflavimicrobium dichotomicum]|uniref:Uncharacterized protein n=1 Tax=Thermoflavimicrobium dichotomicum TaxID=46223 RepID=A0A1I3PL85_9BACL|nr:hypothetical protein [Thermoflavimicrobium dichotomicum]SFJ22474.1 hypothetical protein SAMN05421852_10626 [Thermoflavimicrobium dichotomicum]